MTLVVRTSPLSMAERRVRSLLAPVVRGGRALQTASVYRWLLQFHSELTPTSTGSAIVFAPHQDDETLGCGGVIALKRRAGVSVHVAFLTDGARSGKLPARTELSDGPSYDSRSPPIGTAGFRDREALEATKILGLPEGAVSFLRAADSHLKQLAGEPRRRLIETMAELLRERQPREIFLPHRADGHPDHMATYYLVVEAVAKVGLPVDLFEYPIWLTWLSMFGLGIGPRDFKRAVRVPIQPVLAVKRTAVQQYRSQIATFPAGFLCRFLQPYEIFFRTSLK